MWGQIQIVGHLNSFPFSVTRRYHRSEWLFRLNEGGALLAIGSEEKPLLLTENGERLTVQNLPYRKILFDLKVSF